jgi:hypothetical protein
MAHHSPSEKELQQLTALAEKAERAAALARAAGAPDAIADFQEARARKNQERATEIMACRLAGMTVTQIGERMGLDRVIVHDIIHATMARTPKVTIDDMRAVENSRLDLAQTAIWDRVTMGDDKAIETFLKISTARARLNGLNEAMKIDLSIGVRKEMEDALAELQNVVLGEVIPNAEDTG